MTPKVVLICDLQFGSTGKGLLAGYLAKNSVMPDAVVSAWGPNAGHTFIDGAGRKFVHRMLPNGIVSPKLRRVLIAPGSVIDVHCLWNEVLGAIDILDARDAEVLVHEHAAILKEGHAASEQATLFKIGSTQKGTAEAMYHKMLRDPDNANIARNCGELMHGAIPRVRVVSKEEYASAIDSSSRILVEGAQGYSLGIHSGIYPYTTSRECTPAQIMSDCAIPLNYLHQVVGTLRTYPIRVANRYNAEGEQIGTSGPGYPDQIEKTWATLGLEPEYTTVTKLERRVFTFSWMQFEAAFRACAPNFVFVNFCNYIKEPLRLAHFISEINDIAGHMVVKWTGHGPTEADVRPQFMSASDYETRISVEEYNKPANAPIIR